MKKNLLLVLVLFFSINSKSQNIDQIREAVRSVSQPDINTLFNHYFEPLAMSASHGLNNGWYHTAKTHKKFGFDITIGVNAASTPTSKQTFKFIASEYSEYLSIQGDREIPTIMGDDLETRMFINVPANSLTYAGTTLQHPGASATFDLFGGIGEDLPMNAFPTPTVQVGLGLPFKTDIKLRFMPNIEVEGLGSSLFGLGLQHNLMQYIAPLEKTPLNIALLVAYTDMSVSYSFDNSPIPGQNQMAEYNVKAYTVQAIASLDFPIISLYTGMGYNIGKTNFNLLGEYEVDFNIDGIPSPITLTYTDPLKAEYDANGFRATAGARINLGPFKIFGDYTLQEFNTISAGIALSFR